MLGVVWCVECECGKRASCRWPPSTEYGYTWTFAYVRRRAASTSRQGRFRMKGGESSPWTVEFRANESVRRQASVHKKPSPADPNIHSLFLTLTLRCFLQPSGQSFPQAGFPTGMASMLSALKTVAAMARPFTMCSRMSYSTPNLLLIHSGLCSHHTEATTTAAWMQYGYVVGSSRFL